MRTDTRPLDTQTGRALDMIANMSAAQWINFGQWCAKWAQVFAALDHRTRTAPSQRTPHRTAAQPQRTPQRTHSGRRRKRGKTPAYRKNMRAAEYAAEYLQAHPEAVDISDWQLADTVRDPHGRKIGRSTWNKVKIDLYGFKEDR